MSKQKAYEVFDGDTLVGYVGDGPGPFISTVHSALPYPVLDHVCYTSLSFKHERVVNRIIAEDKDLETAAQGLRSKGLRLVEVPHEKVFMPADKSPRMDPAARDR